MRWSRVALYALSTVAAILVIAIGLLFTLDLGRFKGDAEVLLSDLLNREFAIDGPLHVTVGSSVKLTAENVRLANTDWAADSDMATVGRIEASVNTVSLLRWPIEIESLVADGVRVNLEKNAELQNNWSFFEPRQIPEEELVEAKRPRLPVIADNVRITDIVLSYDDTVRSTPFRFSATELNEEIDAENIVQLSLDGMINDTPVTLSASAGKIDDLVNFENTSLGLQASLGEIEISGEAQFADLLRPSRPTIHLNVDGPNVEYLTDRLNLQRITTGPLALDFNLAAAGTNQSLSINGDIGEFTVVANGQYQDLRHLEEINLSLSASGPQASTIAKMFGATDVPEDPFSIIGNFRRSGTAVIVDGVTVTIGKTQFELQANFENFPNPNGANATVRINGPDIGRFTRLFGLPGRLGGPFKLEADLAPLPDGGAVVDLTATASGLVLRVDGDITDDESLVGTSVQISYEGPTLRTISDALDIESAPAEPFRLDIGVERVAEGLVIPGGSMTIGDDRLSFSGVVGNKPLESGTDIQFSMVGPNLAELLDDFGRDADELPYAPYRILGRIERIPEHYVLHSVTASIGENLEYELSADGIVTDQSKLLGSRLRVGTKGDSIGAITDAAGIDGIPDVPFDVAATVSFVENGYSIEAGRARVGDDVARINGLVGLEPLSRDTNLEFDVSSPDLKGSLASYGVEISQLPDGQLAASGAIRHQGDNFVLQNVVANFAGATAEIGGTLGGLPSLDGTEIRLAVSGERLIHLLPQSEATKGLDKRFNVTADVRLNDNTLEIASALIRVDQTRFNADVTLGLDPMLGHGSVVVTGDSPDVLGLSPQFAEVAVPETAPMELDASIRWSDSLWTVEQLDLKLGKGEVIVQGSIDGPPNFDRTDLTFDWQISDLNNLSVLLNRELPNLPAHLKFHLLGEGEVLSVDHVDAVIGESDINGSFSFRSGEVPTVALDVSSERLVLTPFLPPEPEQSDTPPPAPAPKDRNRKVIPDTPVPTDFLHDVLANVSIELAEIQARERVISDFRIQGSIVDGLMTIDDFGLTSTRGGKLSGRAFMVANDGGAEVAMRLQGSDLGLGLPAYSEEELAQLPHYEIDVGFITEGKSIREMVADVNGYIRLVGGEGRMRAGAMQMFTNDFLSQLLNTLNPFAAENPYSNMKCTTILATVEDGQLVGRPAFVMQSDRLNIFANTKVDLKTERLDVDFNTVPQKGLGISLSNLVNPYVKVGGTLGNPSLSLDPQSTLIQGGAAVATAGLSILAIGIKDRFFSSKDPCGKAVSAADEDFQALREKYGRPPSQARQPQNTGEQ